MPAEVMKTLSNSFLRKYGARFKQAAREEGRGETQESEGGGLGGVSLFQGLSCFRKGKSVGGSLGKGSFSPVLLPHVIGQVRYGRGRKGKHKCWKQSLERRLNISNNMTIYRYGLTKSYTLNGKDSKWTYIYIYMYIYIYIYIYVYTKNTYIR